MHYCKGNPVSMVDPFGLCGENANDQGQGSKYEKWHDLLGVAGMFWDGFDLINGVLYAMEGDYVNAAISFACGIPAVGNIIAGVAKASKIVKAIKTAVKEAAGKFTNKVSNVFSGVRSNSRNRIGNPVSFTDKTYEMALNPELYAKEIAKKYGINLKGSGQKVHIVFNPELASAGKTREKRPNIIEIGPGAFINEEELANTIAHELNHARSFLKGGKAPEDGMNGGYHTGDTLAEYIRICKAYVCGYNDKWLNSLIMSYAKNTFPCGELEMTEYNLTDSINYILN